MNNFVIPPLFIVSMKVSHLLCAGGAVILILIWRKRRKEHATFFAEIFRLGVERHHGLRDLYTIAHAQN